MVGEIVERIIPIPAYKRSAVVEWGERVLSHYLHPTETRKFHEFRSRKRAWEWVGGRIAAKKALRFFMEERRGHSLPLNEIIILNDERGRPFVDLPSVLLSISHKETVALAAVADGNGMDGLGVDLEVIEPRDRAMWEQFFTQDEQHMALRMAREAGLEESTYFTHLWALKEAVLKALGLGLRVDTRQVEVVSLSGGGGARIVLHDFGPSAGGSANWLPGGVPSAWVQERQGCVVAYCVLPSPSAKAFQQATVRRAAEEEWPGGS